MSRSGLTKTRMVLLRGAKTVTESGMRKSKGSMNSEEGIVVVPSMWVPHPRSGIYCPKGHEGVMDDVPVDAASVGQTHWFRNVEGVDKPSPDV